MLNGRERITRGVDGASSDLIYPDFYQDQARVNHSLMSFLAEQKASGALEARFMDEARGSGLNPDRYDVVADYNPDLGEGLVRLMRDGDYGIILGYKQELEATPVVETNWVGMRRKVLKNYALISFDIVNERNRESFEKRRLEPASFENGDMMLVELHRVSTDHSESFLADLRWERFLLILTAAFALNSGFPRILSEPAVNNRSFRENNGRCDYKMRYDVTPARSGFRKEYESGPFVLDFSRLNVDNF